MEALEIGVRCYVRLSCHMSHTRLVIVQLATLGKMPLHYDYFAISNSSNTIFRRFLSLSNSSTFCETNISELPMSKSLKPEKMLALAIALRYFARERMFVS